MSDKFFDFFNLLGGKRSGTGEIEAQIIGGDETTLLGDGFADDLLECPLEQMCGGVIFSCGVSIFADDGLNFVTDGESAFGDFALVNDAIGDFYGVIDDEFRRSVGLMVPQSPTWPPDSA